MARRKKSQSPREGELGVDVDRVLWNSPSWSGGSSPMARGTAASTAANSPLSMVAAREILSGSQSQESGSKISPHLKGSKSPMRSFGYDEEMQDEARPDPLSPERLLRSLAALERQIKVLEIDNRALSSKSVTQDEKIRALEAKCVEQELEIGKLEDNLQQSRVEAALLQEQLGQAKLQIVRLQDTLNLKKASDVARVRCWDTFLQLYTTPANTSDLHLEGRALGDEGALILGGVLDAFTSLTTLALPDNAIAARGMAALAPPLCASATLTRLDLQGNALADGGMPSAAAVITGATLLTRLDLSTNAIACPGAAVLAAALAASNRLTHLTLNHNRIGADGAMAISRALLTNKGVRHLSLGGNLIGDLGTPTPSASTVPYPS